jgi:hypothetical protein
MPILELGPLRSGHRDLQDPQQAVVGPGMRSSRPVPAGTRVGSASWGIGCRRHRGIPPGGMGRRSRCPRSAPARGPATVNKEVDSTCGTPSPSRQATSGLVQQLEATDRRRSNRRSHRASKRAAPRRRGWRWAHSSVFLPAWVSSRLYQPACVVKDVWPTVGRRTEAAPETSSPVPPSPRA